MAVNACDQRAEGVAPFGAVEETTLSGCYLVVIMKGGSFAIDPPYVRRAVEVPVGALHQRVGGGALVP